MSQCDWVNLQAGSCQQHEISPQGQKKEVYIILNYHKHDESYQKVINILADLLIEILCVDVKSRNYFLRDTFRSSMSESKTGLSGSWYSQYTAVHFKEISYINCEIFQAESVRDAAFGCDWVGTPIPFQRCLMFLIATANKGFQLTAGKFVPVSNVTTLNVCT